LAVGLTAEQPASPAAIKVMSKRSRKPYARRLTSPLDWRAQRPHRPPVS
jgi:hypothetical protein